MNFIVIRNYIHKELLEKTRTKYEEFDILGENRLYGGWLLEKLIFTDKIHLDYDYLCFVDEDCVIDNFDDILTMMDTSDVDIIGVPDGNCVHMRFHRPDVPNMFFVIIKTKKIKNINIDGYNNHQIKNGYDGTTFKFDEFEPYYRFFSHIIYDLGCNFFQLKADTSKLDGETTEVFFENKLVAAHTWWSRSYGNADIKKRIDTAVEYYSSIFRNKIKLPFDKIYCLHCVEAKDREENFKKQFSRLGINDQVEIWWTCKHPKVKEISEFLKDTNQYYWNGFGNGSAFNCTREQYQIIKTAYLRGYNSVCIIEDDITFIDDVELIKNVFSSIPEDYDILRLAYTHSYANSGDYFTENNTLSTWGTQMYALNRIGMKYYIDYIDNDYSVADAPLASTIAIKKCGLKNYFCNYQIALLDNEINNNSLIQKNVSNLDSDGQYVHFWSNKKNWDWREFDRKSVDVYYKGNKKDSLLYSFIARELNATDKRLQDNVKVILDNINKDEILGLKN